MDGNKRWRRGRSTLSFYDDIRHAVSEKSRSSEKGSDEEDLSSLERPLFSVVDHDSSYPGVLRVDIAQAFNDEERANTTSIPKSDASPNIFSALPMDEGGVVDGSTPANVTTVEIRHLIAFVPLSKEGKSLLPLIPESVASIMLALHHFNEGITDVVQEIPRNCPVKFTLEIADTMFAERVAIDRMANDVLPRLRHDHSVLSERPVPTALLGPILSRITKPMAQLAAMSELPQLSVGATSNDFDNRDQYPLLARAAPSNGVAATAAVKYLRQVLGTTHVFVLYLDDEAGRDYERAVRKEAHQQLQPMHVVSAPISTTMKMLFPPPPGGPPFVKEASEQDINDALRLLAETHYQHVVVSVPLRYLQKIVDAIRAKSLFGPDMFWLLTRDPTYLSNEVEIDEAMNGFGTIFYRPAELLEKDPRFQAFQTAWMRSFQTPEDERYLIEKMTSALAQGDQFNSTGFSLRKYPIHPHYLNFYNSAMALAIASCHAAEQAAPRCVTNSEEGDSCPPAAFTGQDLYDAMMYNTSFHGPYGRIAFDPQTGSLDEGLAPLVVSNLLVKRDENGAPKLDIHPIYTYENQDFANEDGALHSPSPWQLVGNRSFIYADGTMNAPPSLPPVNVRYIPLLARKIELGMSWAVTVMSMLLIFWTICRRNSPCVKSSQPVFLCMICLGTLLTGLSGVLDSLRDSADAIVLDLGCMLSLWLSGLGHTVTFAALYTKLWRVNRILGGGKHTLTRQTLNSPEVGVSCTVLVILQVATLTIWTVRSPLTYERVARDTVDEYGRPSEEYGTCNSKEDGAFLYYWIPFVLINAVSTAGTVFEAYKARRVSSNYSESRNIFVAQTLILEGWLISLPVYLMGAPTSEYASAIALPTSSFVMLLAVFASKFGCRHANGRSVPDGDDDVEAIADTATDRSQGDEGNLEFPVHAGELPIHRRRASNPDEPLVDSAESVEERLLEILALTNPDCSSWVSMFPLADRRQDEAATAENLVDLGAEYCLLSDGDTPDTLKRKVSQKDDDGTTASATTIQRSSGRTGNVALVASGSTCAGDRRTQSETGRRPSLLASLRIPRSWGAQTNGTTAEAERLTIEDR